MFKRISTWYVLRTHRQSVTSRKGDSFKEREFWILFFRCLILLPDSHFDLILPLCEPNWQLVIFTLLSFQDFFLWNTLILQCYLHVNKSALYISHTLCISMMHTLCINKLSTKTVQYAYAIKAIKPAMKSRELESWAKYKWARDGPARICGDISPFPTFPFPKAPIAYSIFLLLSFPPISQHTFICPHLQFALAISPWENCGLCADGTYWARGRCMVLLTSLDPVVQWGTCKYFPLYLHIISSFLPPGSPCILNFSCFLFAFLPTHEPIF